MVLRHFKLLFCAVFAISLTSCSMVDVKKVDWHGPTKKVLLVPPNIQIYTQYATGQKILDAKKSKASQKYMIESIPSILQKSNAGIIVPTKSQVSSDPTIARLNKFQFETISVLGYWVKRYSLKKGIGSKFPVNLRHLKKEYNADYVLLMQVEDTYRTAEKLTDDVAKGLIVTALFGPGSAGGGDAWKIFGGLVDTNTNEIVWYNHSVPVFGDLYEKDAAQRQVKEILTGFPR